MENAFEIEQDSHVYDFEVKNIWFMTPIYM